jgi:hypothetical protein
MAPGGLRIVSHVVLLSFRALDTVDGCSGCFSLFCDEPKVFRTSSHLVGIHCLVRCFNMTGKTKHCKQSGGDGREKKTEKTLKYPQAL